MLTQKQKIILTVVIIITLVLGAGVTFGIMRWRMNTQKDMYEEQINTLSTTIKNIGPIQSCYTVVKTSQAGGRIIQSDLRPISIPESCIGDSYILDPSSVVGKYFKVSIAPGTPITTDMIMEEKISDDIREVDIQADSWPIGLKEGDYVDFRLVFPQGEDFVVVSHVRIMAINGKTVKVHLSERELLFYGSALVEKYLYQSSGSYTYMSKYLEPGVQKAAKVFYSVPDNIKALLISNPNIKDKAINGTLTREIVKTSLAALMADDNGQGGQSIATGRSDYISKIEEARKKAEDLENLYGESEEEEISITGSEPTETPDESSTSTPTAGGE